MKKHFFIAALPRSRTAWLSVLLSHGDSYCFHEACKYPRNYEDMLKNRPEKFIGDASSGLIESKAWFKDAPLVVVRRDTKDVVRALKQMWPHVEIEELRERMIYCEGLLNEITGHLEIAFDDLEKMETLEKIWNHCIPDIKFDEQRADALQRINITQHWPKEREFLIENGY